MKRIIIVAVVLAVVGVGFFGCKNPSSWGKCLLTYDGNGADGGKAPFEPSEHDQNSLITVAENWGGFTLNGKRFERWLSTLDGDGPTYYPGEAFLIGDDTTLYVDWVDSHGGIDTSFNLGGDANNNIYAVAEQTDGKIYAGGDFTTIGGVTRNRIARLNPDGGVDTSFDPGSGFNGVVNDIVMQPNGLILVAGNFSTYKGSPCASVVRINPDASLDGSFDATGNVGSSTSVIALQSDGKILAGGWNSLTRLDAGGGTDSGFAQPTLVASGGTPSVSTINVQADGKIIVGGSFSDYSSSGAANIVRILSNGTVDKVASVNGPVQDIGVQSSGNIYIVGNFSDVNGNARNRIANFSSDFWLEGVVGGYGPNDTINALSILPDDEILIGGWFSKYDANQANGLVKLFSWGQMYQDFVGSKDVGGYNEIILLKSGKILTVNTNRIYRIWP